MPHRPVPSAQLSFCFSVLARTGSCYFASLLPAQGCCILAWPAASRHRCCLPRSEASVSQRPLLYRLLVLVELSIYLTYSSVALMILGAGLRLVQHVRSAAILVSTKLKSLGERMRPYVRRSTRPSVSSISKMPIVLFILAFEIN
jgi:hypothetical protein